MTLTDAQFFAWAGLALIVILELGVSHVRIGRLERTIAYLKTTIPSAFPLDRKE